MAYLGAHRVRGVNDLETVVHLVEGYSDLPDASLCAPGESAFDVSEAAKGRQYIVQRTHAAGAQAWVQSPVIGPEESLGGLFGTINVTGAPNPGHSTVATVSVIDPDTASEQTGFVEVYWQKGSINPALNSVSGGTWIATTTGPLYTGATILRTGGTTDLTIVSEDAGSVNIIVRAGLQHAVFPIAFT